MCKLSTNMQYFITCQLFLVCCCDADCAVFIMTLYHVNLIVTLYHVTLIVTSRYLLTCVTCYVHIPSKPCTDLGGGGCYIS